MANLLKIAKFKTLEAVCRRASGNKWRCVPNPLQNENFEFKILLFVVLSFSNPKKDFFLLELLLRSETLQRKRLQKRLRATINDTFVDTS